MAILIGAAVDRLIPLRVLPARLIGWPGGVLILLSIGLIVLGLREIIKAGTTFRANRSVSALLTAGPYRHSRNPLYLALSLLQLGLGYG